AQRDAPGQPEDLVHQVDLVGLAAEQERAPGTFDDRHLIPREEPADDGRIERPALLEPVDRQLAADGGAAAAGGQAASRVVTCPSVAGTRARAPGGKSPSLPTSSLVPFSSRTQRAGANRRAKTAIRGVSSSSSLARACGSGTAPCSTDRPLPKISGGPGPGAGRAWNNTIRSARAIPPAGHAVTGQRSAAATLNRCRASASTPTCPPAITRAAASPSRPATSARCPAMTDRSCGARPW